MSSPHRIGILRTGAIGDVCMSIPLACALKQQFPTTIIDWFVREDCADIVRLVNGVNPIVIPKPDSWAHWKQAIQAVRCHHYDALLMIQSSLRSNLLSMFISADRKIGYGPYHRKDGQQWFASESIPCQREHLVDSFMRFGAAIGAEATEPKWDIQLPTHNLDQARNLLSQSRRPRVAICLRSSKAERDWPTERLVELMRRLKKEINATLVVIGDGTAKTRNMYEKIEADGSVTAINLLGKTPLTTTIAVLSLCDCLISPDTGPAHMASLVSTPVVGLYAVMTSKKSGPYHSLHACIDRYDEAMNNLLHIPPHKRKANQRARHPESMRLIEVDDVLAACYATLGQYPTPST